MGTFYYDPKDWEDFTDTPQEFEEALKNAYSDNEREFLEQMRYKIPYEIAASNEVLLRNDKNEDGLYILRVGNGEFQVGRISDDPFIPKYPIEIGGLLGDEGFMGYDLYPYLHHITVREWLRERD